MVNYVNEIIGDLYLCRCVGGWVGGSGRYRVSVKREGWCEI